MRGHCRQQSGLRPEADGEATPRDGPSARLFLCALCRGQVLICSCCDRRQIYWPNGCAREARRRAQRAAAERYQRSYRGRLNHAVRAGRYRARINKVTHQGSRHTASNGLLALAVVRAPRPLDLHCHWCGRLCSASVRQGFLSGGRMPRRIVRAIRK